jgi:hypothetical protein
MQRLRTICVIGFCLVCSWSVAAQDKNKNTAPEFVALPKGSSVLVMAPDVELFSISGGGVHEPKADWTEAAQSHLQAQLVKRFGPLDLTTKFLSEADSDNFAEISALHAAVASSISFHHFGASNFYLPTKAGLLDWSLDEAVKPIHAVHKFDYALFIWIRDSYVSAERKAAMFALALLGVGIPGGAQVGYASLIDLRNGRVMWFNRLARASGDLREAGPAAESVSELLKGFRVAP